MSQSKDKSTEEPVAEKAGKATDREAELVAQVNQLQADIKALAASLASLAEEKVKAVEGSAKTDMQHLLKSGQNGLSAVEDEFGALEKQIKDTIREKPLTSMAGAIAIGFLLAVLAK